MAELNTTHILEVREGIGVPDSIALEPGRVMEPTSVGTLGDWRVDAPGVHDVHAYVYFDGAVLYAMSAEPHDPLFVDDKPVGSTWAPLRAPAKLVMGSAQIVFRSLHEEFEETTEVTAAKPHPRPFAPGAFARHDDDEATRLEPVARRETPARPAPPRPAAGRPPLPTPAANDEPTRIGAPIEDRPRTNSRSAEQAPPSVIVAPPIDLPPPVPASPPAQPSAGSKIAAQWKEASLAKKLQLLLMPFALVAMWIIFRDEPEPPKPSLPASASASAPASASASAPPTTTSITTAVLTPLPTVDAGKVTSLEHDAVEAVAAGNYAAAIRLYDQLAVMHPEKDAYREAARILRAKKDAGL